MDHIAGNLNSDGCGYCHHTLEDGIWKPEWDDSVDQFYKALACSGCGKKNWVKCDFQASGHDEVMNQEENELESIIKKVSDK